MSSARDADDVESGSTASRHKEKRPRSALGRFWRDVRTDRAWRVGLAVVLPLAILYGVPATRRVLGPMVTFLYTIAAYNYIPSVGGALSLSLFWAWHGLASLPVLTALAYAAAAGGKGVLLASLVACAVGLQPVLGTTVVTVFLLHSAGFVLGTLNAALLAPDAAAYVASLWGPTGQLTFLAISCVLLVPFTVLPYIIGPMLLSSRHSFRAAMDVLEEVAAASAQCADVLRMSLPGGEPSTWSGEVSAAACPSAHYVVPK